jgi:hypothetical protein
MPASACAIPAHLLGTSVPKVWNSPAQRPFDRLRVAPSAVEGRSLFGDVVLVIFLLAQCFDGVFTYVGVTTFGVSVEANPVIVALMAALGQGPALMGAKLLAGALGICLHLREIHGAIAVLTLFYLAAAILPWSVIFFL